MGCIYFGTNIETILGSGGEKYLFTDYEQYYSGTFVRETSMARVIFFGEQPSNLIFKSAIEILKGEGFQNVEVVYDGGDSLEYFQRKDGERKYYNTVEVLSYMERKYGLNQCLTVGVFFGDGFQIYDNNKRVEGQAHMKQFVIWGGLDVERFETCFKHEMYHTFQLQHCDNICLMAANGESKKLCKMHKQELTFVKEKFK